MNFKNLKTGTKILSGFLLVVLIAVAIGAIGLVSLNNVGNSFHAVSDVRLPSIEYLGKMEANLEKVQKGYVQLLDNNLTQSERRKILKENTNICVIMSFLLRLIKRRKKPGFMKRC